MNAPLADGVRPKPMFTFDGVAWGCHARMVVIDQQFVEVLVQRALQSKGFNAVLLLKEGIFGK